MKVIFVVGPTGTGKSAFSLMAAKSLGGHILNADSLQFYQGLDIGTAKPTQEERNQVPHHLFDVVPTGTVVTAGDYRQMALKVLGDLAKQGTSHAFVVGGSGFYLQALEKGMYDFGKVSTDIHESVQAEAKANLPVLFEELAGVDPDYAIKIGPQDAYRISRAVELIRMFGRSPSQLRAAFQPTEFPFPLIKFGLTVPRALLMSRLQSRTQMMLKQGLIQETRGALQAAGPDWPPLQSIGYREVQLHLAGKLSTEELESEIIKNTMRLAKRQMTWFRRDTEIAWYETQQGFDRPLQELQGRLCP